MYQAEDVFGKADRILAEARWGVPPDSVPPPRSCGAPHSIGARLASIYADMQEAEEEEEDGEEGGDVTPLLAELVRRERLSVLRVNLYQEDFSLSLVTEDGQEMAESFRLGYEEQELLRCIDNEELPVELVDLLEEAECNLFYAGCVVAELRDFRRSARPDHLCTCTYVLLRPTQRTLLADITRMTSQLSHQQRLQVEAQLALATSGPLCLDSSPVVAVVKQRRLWSRRALFSDILWSGTESRLLQAADRKQPPPAQPLSGPCAEQLRRLTQLQQMRSGASDGQPPPAKRARFFPPINQVPQVCAPSLGGCPSVQQLAKRLQLPADPSRDCSLHLREESSVEWDRGGGRVMHMKLSVYTRPSDDSFHGQLYVDRDYREGRRAGACCRFPLCCRAAADLYVRQCIDIFTEYGKKSAKLTHQVVGQPARITFTRGARERRDSQPAVPAALSQQQRLMAVRGNGAAAGSSMPALTAQLSRPPVAARPAQFSQQVAQALSQPATPAPAQQPPQPPQQQPQPPPLQTIQIKVSAHNSQLTQMLQNQLQHIQVTVAQQPTAPAVQLRQAPAARAQQSSLQALLAGSPSADNPGSSLPGSMLLEKLVASTASSRKPAATTSSGTPTVVSSVGSTKLLPLSFQTPNPGQLRIQDPTIRIQDPSPSPAQIRIQDPPPGPAQLKVETPSPSQILVDQPNQLGQIRVELPGQIRMDPPSAGPVRVEIPNPGQIRLQTPNVSQVRVDPNGLGQIRVEAPSPSQVRVQAPSPSPLRVQAPSPGGQMRVQAPSPGGQMRVQAPSPGGPMRVQAPSPGGQMRVQAPSPGGQMRVQAPSPGQIRMEAPSPGGVRMDAPSPGGLRTEPAGRQLRPDSRGPIRLQPPSPGQIRVRTPVSAQPRTETSAQSRVEQLNPTLTELLNAPPAASRHHPQPPPPPPPPPAVPATEPVSVPAADSLDVSDPNSDLLNTALQLVQNSDLLAELENLDSLLGGDGGGGATSPDPAPAPQPPPPAPQRPAEPPPNVNIINFLSDGANVTNLQHLQQGLQTIPGLQNVQVSIPGLAAPISINVGAPQPPAAAQPRRTQPQQQRVVITSSPQLTSPPPAADSRRLAPSQPAPPAPLVTVSSAGPQSVLIKGERAGVPAIQCSVPASSPHHVFLKPDSTAAVAGTPQFIIATSQPAGPSQHLFIKTDRSPGQPGQQQLVLASQPEPAGQHLFIKPEPSAAAATVLLPGQPAGQSIALVQVPAAPGRPPNLVSAQQLTPQQRQQLLIQTNLQQQQRKTK